MNVLLISSKIVLVILRLNYYLYVSCYIIYRNEIKTRWIKYQNVNTVAISRIYFTAINRVDKTLLQRSDDVLRL